MRILPARIRLTGRSAPVGLLSLKRIFSVADQSNIKGRSRVVGFGSMSASDETMQFTIEISRSGRDACSYTLPAGRHRIGRRLDNDLIVAGASADYCLELIFDSSEAKAHALMEGVVVADVPMAINEKRALPVAAVTEFDGHLLVLTDAPFARALNSRRTGKVLQRVAGWALLLGSAAILAASLVVSELGMLPVAARTSVPKAIVDRTETPPNIALRDMLQKIGLRLSVESSLDGKSLIVSGNATPREKAQIDEIAGVWRERSTTPVSLNIRVSGSYDLLIRAVGFKPRPFIVDGLGRRYTPGAVIDNGWVLKSISPSAVYLTRDGVSERISLK